MLWVGGLRALFLQALHPAALAGVTSFSDYRDDPWGRLHRTAEWIGVVSYGSHAEVRAAAERVRGLHRRVGGTDPVSGRAYRATDPDLLLWIHLCLVDSLLEVSRRSGSGLSRADADRYVAEQVRTAELVGLPASAAPDSVAGLHAAIEGYRGQLRVSPSTREVARFVLLPPLPAALALLTPARPMWAAVAGLALSTLPGWARRLYGLPGLVSTDLSATLALRAMRLAAMGLPTAVREGPHLRAARGRLAVGLSVAG